MKKVVKKVLNIEDLSSRTKTIESLLDQLDLNIEIVLEINDSLEDIYLSAQKIHYTATDLFSKSSALNIMQTTQNLFRKVEKLEHSKVLEDESFLRNLHEVLYSVDLMELKFLFMIPSEIEREIDLLDEKLNQLSEKHFFNDDLLNHLIKDAKLKLARLKFRLDYPILEELHHHSPHTTFYNRVLFLAKKAESQDLTKAQELKNLLVYLDHLAHIAFVFSYQDSKEAIEQYEKLEETLKDDIERNLWRISQKNYTDVKKNIVKDHAIMTRAIMKFISNTINEG